MCVYVSAYEASLVSKYGLFPLKHLNLHWNFLKPPENSAKNSGEENDYKFSELLWELLSSNTLSQNALALWALLMSASGRFLFGTWQNNQEWMWKVRVIWDFFCHRSASEQPLRSLPVLQIGFQPERMAIFYCTWGFYFPAFHRKELCYLPLCKPSGCYWKGKEGWCGTSVPFNSLPCE